MVKTSLTTIICLPKHIEKFFDKEISRIYKQYGKTRLSGDADGVYYNVPHITLFSMGNCVKNKELISKKLDQILVKQEPIQIKLKKLICFKRDKIAHVVVEVEKSKELQGLHELMYSELKDLVEPKDSFEDEFVLNKFKPHLTIIASIPEKLCEQIKNEIVFESSKFMAIEVGIKLKEQGKKAKMYKRLDFIGF